MENNYFINEAINQAINDYLVYKNSQNKNWNFLLYVIEVLTYIYDEADIINPFMTKEENVFKKNLLKYGVDKRIIDKLLDDINKFYIKDQQNRINGETRKNYFFTYVQEDLIDLFIAKFKNSKLADVELENFQKFIFSNKSSSQFQIRVNNLMAISENEAIYYFETKKYELYNVISFDTIKRNVLDSSAYKVFGIDEEKIADLSQEDLDVVNKKILSYFKMSPIEPNLNKKIQEKALAFQNVTKLQNNGKISIYLFLIIIILVIILGFYLGYKMVG